MEKKDEGLWTGGDWEQPDFRFTPPQSVHIPDRQPPVLRKKRRRRWKYRIWPTWGGWLFLILFLIGVVGTCARWIRDARTEHSSQLPPWSESIPDSPRTLDHLDPTPPNIPQAPTGTGFTLTLHGDGQEPMTFPEIYDNTLPSMVSIETYRTDNMGTGSGIILSEDGYIVTNAHVVASGELVRVILPSNQVVDAQLVGFAPRDDLAVLKVEAEGLTPARFGDSQALHCGDRVAALGDPLGYRATITDGIVSALDREMPAGDDILSLIQISAAINLGSSGGALLNQYGQVVGITAVKVVTSDGSAEALNFAIPSRRVKFIADALIDGRTVVPGVFGITVATHAQTEGGLEILSVDPDSDCAAQGLAQGDTVLKAEGQSVTSPAVLSRIKQERGAGDLVDLVLRSGRTGEEYAVSVHLVD